MTDVDARLARVLAAIHQPGPVDDSPGGYERDDDPGEHVAAVMGDRAADVYEREMDRRWSQ